MAAQCSSFTHRLYGFQCDFHKAHSKESTLSGKFMTHCVGRVISIAVTLLLHAEAVYRAVAICFLVIRDSFFMTNEELLSLRRKNCVQAYEGSLKSFYSLVNRDILNTQIAERIEIFPQVPSPRNRVDRPPSPILRTRLGLADTEPVLLRNISLDATSNVEIEFSDPIGQNGSERRPFVMIPQPSLEIISVSTDSINVAPPSSMSFSSLEEPSDFAARRFILIPQNKLDGVSIDRALFDLLYKTEIELPDIGDQRGTSGRFVLIPKQKFDQVHINSLSIHGTSEVSVGFSLLGEQGAQTKPRFVMISQEKLIELAENSPSLLEMAKEIRAVHFSVSPLSSPRQN